MGPRRETLSAELEGQTEPTDQTALCGLCWPGFTFDRERVRELGVSAYCWTPDGELWEYEDAAFFRTGRGDRGVRRGADGADAPREGWSHPADCACLVCRVTR